MRHVRMALLAGVFSLTAVFLAARPASALGEIEKPKEHLPAPDDWVCVESGWSYYYYELPVIFQDTGPDGQPVVVAFGYADGCKQTGHGQRGGTHANLQVLTDPVWAPDVVEKMTGIAQDLVPLEQALNGLGLPADNAFRTRLPDLSLHYKDLYNDSYLTACKSNPDDPETICPGIPTAFSPLLATAGFDAAKDGKGYDRYLLDASIIRAKAVGWFWNSSIDNTNTPGNFYGRNWGQGMADNHSYGGVMRIVLNPIDLSLSCQGATIKPGAQAVGGVRVAINQPRAVATHVGWRLAGTSDWQEGAVVPASALAGSDTADISFPLPGVTGGQQVEFMVNYDRKVAEMGDNPTESAYLNNSCTSVVDEARPNLEIYDIWFSPAKPNPGDAVLVTVTVKNSSAAGYGSIPITSLRWTAAGKTYTSPQQQTLAPGEEHRFELGSFTASDPGAVTVTAEVNPDHDQPPDETTWTDNTTSIAVPVAGAVDLRVAISAPASAVCDTTATVPVRWTFHNPTSATLKAVPYFLTLTADGRSQTLIDSKIALTPGDTTRSLNVPVSGCGTDMTFTVSLNLPAPGPVAETDYSNNTATAVTTVADAQPSGSSSQPDSITVIVPANCIPSVDPADVHPCQNYPNLVIPQR